MYTPASGRVKPYQNTVLRRMENRLVFRRILPLTPRAGSGYNLPSSKKSPGGRGREHLPRLRLLLGADDPRTRPSEDRLRDPQSRGTRDELRGAHGRGGRARPPPPEGISLHREGPARLLGNRSGDERRPAPPGLYGE